MKKVLYPIVLLAIAFASCNEPEKPNVILFLVDDMGWTDLKCYGSDFYQTPNIDQLAEEGVRFTNAYSSCGVCSPTRASIMTGKYPARLHLTNITDGSGKRDSARFLPPEYVRYMDSNEYTLADALRDGGYTTIHLGKWHLGKEEKYWPENRGFDINIGGWRPGMPIIQEGKSNGYFSPYGNPRLSDGEDGEYLTERLADEAVNFLKQQKGKKQPFFMNFWFYTVHTPIQAREEKTKKYEALVDSSLNHTNPVYAGMVEHLDEAVGKVMATLKECGFDDNTLVIFSSDNGGALGRKQQVKITSNFPLKSGKGDMFEGGTRVPFIARWNKRIKEGTFNHTPVISMDIYPTLLKLTNTTGNPVQNEQMDGVDISDLLIDEKPLERDAIYWHFPHYNGFGARPFTSIRKGDWKLIEVFEYDTLLLYDLKNDIGERTNLALKNPEKAQELLEDIQKWRNSVNAQMPVENPDYQPELINEN